jgi:pimeloyl-ACP methyl ester carboxylesterase
MLPLFLLPGMGGDARMFQPQLAALPCATVPAWIAPEPQESLPSFAARMARVVDPGGPCFVGGASFGGMVAVEMARHLEARACFLIGSVRTPAELPPRTHMYRWLARTTGAHGLVVVPRAAAALDALASRWMSPAVGSMVRQLADTDRKFFRWAALAVLQWEPSAAPSVPVLQIHGDEDHMLPHRFTRPDMLVHGAGHLLSMSHGDEVIQFLRAGMEKYGWR